MELKTAEDIRKALIDSYPEVTDDEFVIHHSGFVHDHPTIAIGVVLISSVMLGTTDPVKLAEFTGYSELFLRGIAINMENSLLWKDNKYDCSSWFSGNLVPVPSKRLEGEGWAFWQHVMIAEGLLMEKGADPDVREDSCSIFWDDMLAKAKARGIMMWRNGKRVL